MSTYSIDRTWMVHSGGTKFYQVFRVMAFASRVEGDRENSVTVLHYGGFKADFTPLRRPVSGGQVRLLQGDSYREKIEEKRKTKKDGNYEIRIDSHTTFQTYPTASDLGRELRLLLGSASAEELLIMLGLSAKHGAWTDKYDEEPPNFIVNNDPIENPTAPAAPRPEAWGSW